MGACVPVRAWDGLRGPCPRETAVLFPLLFIDNNYNVSEIEEDFEFEESGCEIRRTLNALYIA